MEPSEVKAYAATLTEKTEAELQELWKTCKSRGIQDAIMIEWARRGPVKPALEPRQ